MELSLGLVSFGVNVRCWHKAEVLFLSQLAP